MNTVKQKDDPELYDLFKNYRALKNDISVMEETLKKYRDDIIAKSGGESIQCENFRLRKSEVSRIDYKSACTENNIDVSKYKKHPYPTYTITDIKSKTHNF